MGVGYKEYGTCPKVWMVVCVDSGGSPTEAAAKEGLFFLFLNMHAGKNQKQGSPPRFAQAQKHPRRQHATRLARPRLRRCFFSLCSRMCMLWGEGDWCIAACNAWAHACRSGAHRMQVGCVEQVSHRSCPPLGCPPEIIRGSTFMCKTVYDMIQSHFLPSRLDAVGERQHLGIYL